MFRIEMLSAKHGDCLWIEYGDESAPNVILIDTGPLPTYEVLQPRLRELAEKNRQLELMVLTHIDTDHVDTAVKIFNTTDLDFSVREIWFNGWQQVRADLVDQLGGEQGEYLDALIARHRIPWNASFGSSAAAVGADGKLPTVQLPGGMKITLLSPDLASLGKLRLNWQKAVIAAGWTPGDRDQALAELGEEKRYWADDTLGEESDDVAQLADKTFRGDPSVPNGSSIAFLAEYGDKSALLLGDAHAPTLMKSLQTLIDQRGRLKLKVDAVKVPHHGSKNNVSKELVQLIDARYFLVSTNGDQFRHPDREAIARIVTCSAKPPTICFNYLSSFNSFWKSLASENDSRYKLIFPDPETAGLAIDL